MKGSCTVLRCEAAEIVDLTKTIDGAVVSILSTLVDNSATDAIARDLAEIASASLYVRDQIEQAIKRADKANDAPAETAVTS